MQQARLTNPFYAVLLVVGVVFAITACAYCVMTVRGLDPRSVDEEGLMGLMRQHGLTIMVGELAALGVLTFAAIGTDEYWTGSRGSGVGDRETGAGNRETASGGREPPEKTGAERERIG